MFSVTSMTSLTTCYVSPGSLSTCGSLLDRAETSDAFHIRSSAWSTSTQESNNYVSILRCIPVGRSAGPRLTSPSRFSTRRS